MIKCSGTPSLVKWFGKCIDVLICINWLTHICVRCEIYPRCLSACCEVKKPSASLQPRQAAKDNDCLCFSLFLFPLTGRWYIREGWLKMVPPKGADAKPKMFFLFSDMLLQAKRCSPLHPTNGDKFVGQHAYPLQDCSVEKVFGHTRSRGGLLSVSVSPVRLKAAYWSVFHVTSFFPKHKRDQGILGYC